jgi:transposase
MRLGRPVAPIVLTAEERETLERWARRPTTAQALALRARLVLRCAGGETATAIAKDVHVTKQTVGKWRGRFLARRLDGLLDEPRPGVPRKITDADVERVLTTTLESTPRDATHWSTRSLAKQCDMSQTAVARIWKAFALQPHRVDTFKLSKDPLFIDKVRDIVGLYLNPPERALLLSVDKRVRSKPWTAPRRFCRCARVSRSVGRTIIFVTARLRCLRHSTSRPGASSANCTAAIAVPSSCGFSAPSTRRSQQRSTFI